MEEVGLKVKNIRYYKSQPWAFSDSLLFVFFCKLDGNETISIDTRELSEAVWMNRNEIPNIDDEISLICEMIIQFKNHKI